MLAEQVKWKYSGYGGFASMSVDFPRQVKPPTIGAGAKNNCITSPMRLRIPPKSRQIVQ
jgi:hypothetical protein